MNIRLIAIAAASVVATSAALAAVPASSHATTEPAALAERTLPEEITAGMRELLLDVTPEIALPKIELARLDVGLR